MQLIASLFCGLMFGAGLLISGMTQPSKVLAFLDIFGAWDPSLAVVMVAALAVAVPGFMMADRAARPLLAKGCSRPTKTQIDRPLLIGAAVFGTGWGLAGLCPGPALENLATLSPGVIGFVLAMATGMLCHTLWQSWRPADKPVAVANLADG
jgi:uncharacterized membrane protein YedE/YeeE